MKESWDKRSGWLTRRELLRAIASAGGLAALPPAARGALYAASPGRLYPPIDLSAFDTPLHRGPAQLRIGYAAITWNGKDTQAIEEISALGYSGIQLRANALQEYPDPGQLKDLLAAHKLTFVALSSGTTPLDRTQRRSVIDGHIKNAKYLQAAGGRFLQLIGGSSKDGQYTAQDYLYQAQMMTEIARLAADHGVQTGFHNHMGTVGQTPAAVDAVLAAADPRYLKFELDVAHYTQGGGDPAAAIRKYARRLLFLHLKDVKSDSGKNGYQFTELGSGRVDFAAIFDALHDIDFRGWGVVELDGERPGVERTPKESAEISKQYLQRKVGIRV